tara:strand:+ start:413 stop:868 length:456 start_codon:yes stop_codon:yes gene_type:complete
MATIPDTQQFHTVAGKVDTANKGSELANSDRRSYTMQDIKDTVSAGGGVDGSGTAGKLSKWSDANTLTDSKVSESGTIVTIAGVMSATGAAIAQSFSLTPTTTNTAPASATDSGVKGEIRFVGEGGPPATTGAIYLCIETDTWVKVALATF